LPIPRLALGVGSTTHSQRIRRPGIWSPDVPGRDRRKRRRLLPDFRREENINAPDFKRSMPPIKFLLGSFHLRQFAVNALVVQTTLFCRRAMATPRCSRVSTVVVVCLVIVCNPFFDNVRAARHGALIFYFMRHAWFK
jgi:hypothetical protein